VLPPLLLTGFLVLTFTSALSIGYKPLAPGPVLWLAISALISVKIWVARGDLGTVTGWQLYWGLTRRRNAGRRGDRQPVRPRRHAAAARRLVRARTGRHDPLFSLVIPLTVRLADTFAGFPLDPSIGFRAGVNNANIGIGDLLVYTLVTVAATRDTVAGRPPAAWALC
jgi:hypothetical protein